eukprot:2574898-Amphidinium_carterae.2
MAFQRYERAHGMHRALQDVTTHDSILHAPLQISPSPGHPTKPLRGEGQLLTHHFCCDVARTAAHGRRNPPSID